MKKTLIGIILLITVSSLLVSCFENETKDDILTKITDGTTALTETIESIQTSEANESTVPELPISYEIHIPVTDNNYNDVQNLLRTLDKMIEAVDAAEVERSLFYFGDACIDIRYNSEFREIISITAHGQTYIFGEHSELDFDSGFIWMNNMISMIPADGVFVYARILYSSEFTVILSEQGIITSNDPGYISNVEDSEWYNRSFVTYGIDENSKLTYTRTPEKYTDNAIFDDYQYCCGLDEFAKEEGYATIENSQIVYTPQKVYTVEEVGIFEQHFTMKEMFYYCLNSFMVHAENEGISYKEYCENRGLAEVYTFEELIEYNKAHYVPYT